MKKILGKFGFNKQDIVSYGNMFLLANGRYGYRGTLEEYTSNELVNLNVLAFYDKYQDKWREPINLPNPLSIVTSVNDVPQSVLLKEPISHRVELDIFNATFSRLTKYKDVTISSTRFLSSKDKNLLVSCYKVRVHNDVKINIELKVDLDINEINGPHFLNKQINIDKNLITFKGETNEHKTIQTFTLYESKETLTKKGNSLFINGKYHDGDEILVHVYSYIDQHCKEDVSSLYNLSNKGYDTLLEEHKKEFSKKWDISRVIIDNEDAQFEMDYSIYHLLILEDKESYHSIPARGLSGQTYKGAIFWDTEIFILPFFLLTNPSFAKNLLIYRINTLQGAKEKAKELGYSGAFYAWESQDDGLEQCSKYNVTDPITNEPIRTYFGEKQIHISADVALAFDRYIEYTGDKSILNEGGYEVIDECAKFFISRATLRDNQYHYDDVIGPDEYHERINDNAFTNYLAAKTIELAIKYSPSPKKEYEEFLKKIYLPIPNEEGIIEQFDGYYSLEDAKPEEVKKRVRNEKEYLGGLACSTKTIKQADVISLIAIVHSPMLWKYAKENYHYYLPYTEHGSSLSSSMYSIVASHIGESETSYKLFRKSSGIDLGTDQKMYAGGIYIGGTHPASNAGAYLSIIFGFLGFCVEKGKPRLNPHLPKEIKKVEFKFYYQNKLYVASVEGDKYQIREVLNDD